MLQHVLDQRQSTVDVVTLDDLTERQLAVNDPAMFLQIHQLPVMVDEVQYAPNLFSEIKMMVDKGAFMENFVVSEIYKSFVNTGVEPPLYYYRDRDGKEIDIVMESDGELHPIEVKKTASPNLAMTQSFEVLDKSLVPRGCGAVICAAEKFSALDGNTLVISAGLL